MKQLILHPAPWILVVALAVGFVADSPDQLWTRLALYTCAGLAISQAFVCIQIAIRRGPTTQLGGHALIGLAGVFGIAAFLGYRTIELSTVASLMLVAGSALLAQSVNQERLN